METAETLSTAIPGDMLRLGVTLLLGTLAMTAVARLRPMTRGTTLVAPWCWALAGTLAVSCAAAWNGSASDGEASAWIRYVAGATLLAPPMAILGAKRPQDRAWQWVVLSLVAFALLPAGHQWLYHPGSDLRLETAWQWFVLVIATVGAANYLLTSRALAAAIAGLALYSFLGEQFPAWLRFSVPERDLAGLGAVALAAHLAQRTPAREGLAPHDRAWRDFRDLFGATWGLRCAERFNIAASQAGWRAALGWHGFDLPADQPTLTPPEVQCLENLLRRFVSPEWIAARMNKNVGEGSRETTVQEVNRR